jgi:lipopolysaccharide export system permease protein
MLTLLGLSRSLELVVARASGVSVWGFLRTPFLLALVLGALTSAVFNPFAVALKEQAENVEAELRGLGAREGGHWLRQEGGDGSSILYARSAGKDGLALFGITAFVFDASGEFVEKVLAPRARHEPRRWVLEDADIASAVRPPYKQARYELPTQLTAAELGRSFMEAGRISVWSLPGFIETAERTGLNSDSLRVAFHSLLNRPFVLLAMVMIAATVSLRLPRFGGVWRLALSGAAMGFLLYSATEIVNDLGGNGIVNPILAGWLPAIVALTFGTTALLYQEDG